MSTTHKEALEAAYLAGFNASGEGYNGEYPFGDKMQDPAENRAWKKDRDNYIKEALMSFQDEAQPVVAEQHKQEPVAHTAIFHCPNCEYPHRQVTHITGVAQPPWLPQRTWVGLTEDEINQAYADSYKGFPLHESIEAKLKAKNERKEKNTRNGGCL